MKLIYLLWMQILWHYGSVDSMFKSNKNQLESCFCQLHGVLDDCTCSVDTVDHFNNVLIYPRLQSLLVNDYFRFYKVNLKKPCPFWSDDSRCAIRYCHVEACHESDIPTGLKGHVEEPIPTHNKYTDKSDCTEPDDLNEELSYLNKTISADLYKEFALWKKYDDAQDNFCINDNEGDTDAEYVDLLLNPERYTGYKGPSAHRIWRSIYKENCFRPKKTFTSHVLSDNINNMCLEKRVFYRVVSGLHASINIHLCSKYLLSETKKDLSFGPIEGQWGPNLDEFTQRFDPETTNGEGPQWLRNLYFIYLLELRALAKAAPYLLQEQYFTGNELKDEDVRAAIKDLLQVIRSFPEHFNESTMFNGGQQAQKLKEEFRLHFQNISKIMDCVGCDKCKLWGKLQVQGLGTALKILFSGKFDNVDPNGEDISKLPKRKFQLERSEIVALLNAFGRLSTSIYELEEFRRMAR
ncbi:ero1-like protein isoform X2 [Chrysoperla carnea]|uniref:ero1-like protein isoform X2 n=1 Tax=Chrysoperla carnea TaxID=189513 RepID=UPI001D091D13|nr:ero1-like protein isoform X2 [Chrysoperla carnea]